MNQFRHHQTPLAQALSVALIVGAGMGSAPALAQDVNLGVLDGVGFRIDGAGVDDNSGFSVSGAGDVNGDGLADLIVGARWADPNGDVSAGSSYVVFGKNNGAPVSLINLSTGGFRIDGAAAFDRSGYSASGAGDVNGDGLADLIVGASGASTSDAFAGSAYVVFGKADGSVVSLGDLSTGGFRIDGAGALDYSGFSVSGAGDVNGDGLADVIVGALGADPNSNSLAGSSYVVFGKADGSAVNLSGLGIGGFRIDGAATGDRAGFSVSGAGDVNGDGLADVIVGAFGADPNSNSLAGSSYVVFGKADGAAISLSGLGNTGGFRIDGAAASDYSGLSVAGAGDVNGDGLSDLIVGARGAGPNGDSGAGSSYVVFGKAGGSAVNLSSLSMGGSPGGFRIDGVAADDYSGVSVSGAGDVNGDGLADLIVGADRADPNGNLSAGSSYVVFGKANGSTVSLSNLGPGGFQIDGAAANDYSGISVSGAGDVNGDGLADLIVGASGADPNGDTSAGSSYVIFSQQTPNTTATYHGKVRRGDAPRLALGTSGDGSNASHPDSRAWIDFAAGSAALLLPSTESVARIGNAGTFPAPAADVHLRWQTNRVNWTSAEVQFRYTDSELLIANENTLRLVHSIDGNAPFTPLISVVNPLDNTISAMVDESGYFYLGQLVDDIFRDGFEDGFQ